MPLSHNDNPTLTDAFGNGDFIREICQLISDCTPPKGIGLNGYWGTGKTSALLQVYHRLTGISPFGKPPEDAPPRNPLHHDKTIVPVWFEAWRYQHESQPIVALLHEIRAQMGIWAKAGKGVAKIGEVTLRGVFSAFDEVMKTASGGVFKPNLGKLQELGEAWEKERYQQQLPGQKIHALLEEAIKAALPGSPPKRLLIFIDDLDRCEPETALRLMEGIKIYLSLSNCVVLFGMDQRQVERALAKAMSLPVGNADHYAREYLEKICQDIMHLPLADKKRKADFLSRLLGELDLGGCQAADLVKAAVEAYDCLPANPRKIKSLANRLACMCRRLGGKALDATVFVTPPSGGAVQRGPALLLAVAVLHCFHRPVYEQLQKNPGYIATVREYASSAASLEDLAKNADYEPMKGIFPSRTAGKELPVNPSDSNVFRLHQLLADLDIITADEVRPFLNL